MTRRTRRADRARATRRACRDRFTASADARTRRLVARAAWLRSASSRTMPANRRRVRAGQHVGCRRGAPAAPAPRRAHREPAHLRVRIVRRVAQHVGVDGRRADQRLEREAPDARAGGRFARLRRARGGAAAAIASSRMPRCAAAVRRADASSPLRRRGDRSIESPSSRRIVEQRLAPPLRLRRTTYGSRPSVSQIAARTSGSASTFNRATGPSSDRHRTGGSIGRGGRRLAAFSSPGRPGRSRSPPPRASPAADDAAAARCRRSSDGRSRRPSARTATRTVCASPLCGPERIVARSRGVGARRSSAWRTARRVGASAPARRGREQQTSQSTAREQRELARAFARAALHARRCRVAAEYSSICAVRSSGYEIVDVGDLAGGVGDRLELRHDEAGVGRQVQAIDARDDLVAQRRIEMHAVGLEQRARRVVVALRLDPLHLGEQPADAVAERLRRRSSRSRSCRRGVRTSIAAGVRHQPVDDHLPVAHVVFFDAACLRGPAAAARARCARSPRTRRARSRRGPRRRRGRARRASDRAGSTARRDRRAIPRSPRTAPSARPAGCRSAARRPGPSRGRSPRACWSSARRRTRSTSCARSTSSGVHANSLRNSGSVDSS